MTVLTDEAKGQLKHDGLGQIATRMRHLLRHVGNRVGGTNCEGTVEHALLKVRFVGLCA
jgi:hypothetical protein